MKSAAKRILIVKDIIIIINIYEQLLTLADIVLKIK